MFIIIIVAIIITNDSDIMISIIIIIIMIIIIMIMIMIMMMIIINDMVDIIMIIIIIIIIIIIMSSTSVSPPPSPLVIKSNITSYVIYVLCYSILYPIRPQECLTTFVFFDLFVIPLQTQQIFTCGFYHHFNNLCFRKRTSMTCSAAHVVISFVSSDILRCRLLKWLLDHPMEY